MIHSNSRKNNVKRELSSCIVEKVLGFEIARPMQWNKSRVNLKPIDIFYKPEKHFRQKVNCLFRDKKYLAYRTTNLIRKNCKIEHTNAYKCFSCSHIFFNFVSKKRFENHIKNDSGVPGSLYKFENQNFITFEDNYKFIGDLLFAVYFDFETTTTAKGGYNSEVCEMYSISLFYNLCIPSKIEQ